MEWTGLAIILAAISVGSFVKGVTGSGLPLLSIPVMAAFLGVERAVVVMAVPGIVSNAWMIWRYRSHLTRTRDLPLLVGAGVLGVVGGTWLLDVLDPRVLSGVLAALIVGYVALRLTRPSFALRPAMTRVLSGPVGLAAGGLQGATGIAGPLLNTYLHSYHLEPPAYVLSLVTLYETFALAQASALAGLGLLTARRLAESLLVLAPIAVLLPLGARVSPRLSRRTFDLWVLALLVASAGKLAHAAFWG